ncbi:hypothetical protein EYR38_009291 [Pleurotus pulmonarius]|nr:hypothetical protein EYR38_009291 [Pleurotus pulmonarius]
MDPQCWAPYPTAPSVYTTPPQNQAAWMYNQYQQAFPANSYQKFSVSPYLELPVDSRYSLDGSYSLSNYLCGRIRELAWHLTMIYNPNSSQRTSYQQVYAMIANEMPIAWGWNEKLPYYCPSVVKSRLNDSRYHENIQNYVERCPIRLYDIISEEFVTRDKLASHIATSLKNTRYVYEQVIDPAIGALFDTLHRAVTEADPPSISTDGAELLLDILLADEDRKWTLPLSDIIAREFTPNIPFKDHRRAESILRLLIILVFNLAAAPINAVVRNLGKYAILSHRWQAQGQEVTFGDMPDGIAPHSIKRKTGKLKVYFRDWEPVLPDDKYDLAYIPPEIDFLNVCGDAAAKKNPALREIHHAKLREFDPESRFDPEIRFDPDGTITLMVIPYKVTRMEDEFYVEGSVLRLNFDTEYSGSRSKTPALDDLCFALLSTDNEFGVVLVPTGSKKVKAASKKTRTVYTRVGAGHLEDLQAVRPWAKLPRWIRDDA